MIKIEQVEQCRMTTVHGGRCNRDVFVPEYPYSWQGWVALCGQHRSLIEQQFDTYKRLDRERLVHG